MALSPRARSAVARAIALWFGCGRVPKAPGTAGTLGAVPLYLLLRRRGRGAVALGAVAASVVGVWAASIVEEELGVHDAQVIVVDEVAGLLVTMLGARRRGDVLRGVALFRAFDVLKPWPCRAAERLPRGLGVVADDLVAGVFAALVLRALR